MPEEESYRRPADPQLLEEFLSLRPRQSGMAERSSSAASDALTFVSATTHISARTEVFYAS